MINPSSLYFMYRDDEGAPDNENPFFRDIEFNLIFDDNSCVTAISFDGISLSVNALDELYGEAKKWETQTSGNRKIVDIKSNASTLLLYSHNDKEKIDIVLSKTVSFKEHFDVNILPHLQCVVDIHMDKVGFGCREKHDIERKEEFSKFRDNLLFKHYDEIENLILINRLSGILLYDKIKGLHIPQLA